MENSKRLLEYALAALSESNIPEDKWSIGGGTVLASIYNHRMSKDIDIFIEDVQNLPQLSPRFNQHAELALDYHEMSHYISLTFPEGKIDFIASPQITEFSSQIGNFLGKIVRLDDPVEIVVKKLYFRGERTLPRDILDLAVVYKSNRNIDLINSMLAIPQKINAFSRNFANRQRNVDFLPYTKEYEDMLLESGQKLRNKEFDICQTLIESIKNIEQILSWVPSFIQEGEIDLEIIFKNAAKEILESHNNRWTANTNKMIIEKLCTQKYTLREIGDSMKYSPIYEENIETLMRELDQRKMR